MTRCLVTGGAGFIGSNLVDSLVGLGHEVIVIDNESAESNSGFFWRGDTCNYKVDISSFPMAGGELIKIFRKHSPQIIFHLAALTSIPLGIKNPIKTYAVNTMGTCNLLQLALEFDAKRFIFSSASSVYGLKNQPPISEDSPKDCLNPYSSTKSAAEDSCRMYSLTYGLETICLRYFNVYGERQPTKGAYASVVGAFLNARKSGEALKIYGDGSQERDFIHVGDVVRCNILSAFSHNKKAPNSIINVGTGESTSILSLAKMISDNIDFLPERDGEVKRSRADISNLKKILNFTPENRLKAWIENCK